MKVIDLLNKIANGEEIPIIKFKLNQHRFKYNKKDKFFDDIDNYSRCKCSIEFCELNDEVEIIEEQQDIDIQSIEEIPKILFLGTEKNDLMKVLNDIIDNQNLQLQAVKQLEKKIKEK